LSGIESLCLGTPVLGANIGGIPEMIEENRNGMLFESRNVGSLVEKINQFFVGTISFNYESIVSESREKFSADKYYQSLIEYYKK